MIILVAVSSRSTYPDGVSQISERDSVPLTLWTELQHRITPVLHCPAGGSARATWPMVLAAAIMAKERTASKVEIRWNMAGEGGRVAKRFKKFKDLGSWAEEQLTEGRWGHTIRSFCTMYVFN